MPGKYAVPVLSVKFAHEIVITCAKVVVPAMAVCLVANSLRNESPFFYRVLYVY